MRGHQQSFLDRLRRTPVHGLGLSVDVYSPDLSSLLRTLRRRQVLPDYLEVFRATPAALAAVKAQSGGLRLAYHGEGLWLTQPDAVEDPAFDREIGEVARQLGILDSAWSNHECATKEIAGVPFGTYLPPLYTPAGAEVVAANARVVQHQLDTFAPRPAGGSPLLLLEMPPLTYFAAGTVPIAEFFRRVSERTACGFVLDIGHLWTVYRYAGCRNTSSLEQFVREFIADFPLDRVVEIHVAGLAAHESSPAAAGGRAGTERNGTLPYWIDAHTAPIPPVLFTMLDQILQHPRLTALKGLALEVDTKPVELIVEEFESFLRRYRGLLPEEAPVPSEGRSPAENESAEDRPVALAIRTEVREGYERYARIVSGRMEPASAEWTGPFASRDELDRYRAVYLPHEILRWGGDVEAMFPETCRRLADRAIALSLFVPFWFREGHASAGSYDFFLIKIERFLDFAHAAAPDLDALAAGEAEQLRRGYAAANEPVVSAAEKVQ